MDSGADGPMKTMQKLPGLMTLCTCLLLIGSVQAATPSTAPSRLDKHLAPIAEAAEEHREGPLMNRALLRQGVNANSPFEARWNEAGAVQVYLHYTIGGAGPDIAALKELGATGITQSDALKVVQAWVPATELNAASSLPGVSRVGLPRYAIHKRIVPMGPHYNTGSVTTEGDQILGATQFRKIGRAHV